MNGKHYIGDRAATFKSTGRTRGIDGVALVVDDGTEYKAGDQLGYVLELECPYGTQAMADALLEKLRGKSYEGFETTGAALPSGAELGDGVTVKGLYAPIVRRRVQFVGDLAADVSAPTGGDTDHEFGFTDPTQRQIQRAAARSRSYIDKKADEIKIGVEGDVDGKLSEITVDLEGITSRVQSTENGLSTVSGQLSLKVGRSENNQIVSMLNASANEINISGNRFVLDSDNFKVAADGTAEMTGANVSGDVKATSFSLNDMAIRSGVEEYKDYELAPDKKFGYKVSHSDNVDSLIVEAANQIVAKGYLSGKRGAILQLYSEALMADKVTALDIVSGPINTYGPIIVHNRPGLVSSASVTASRFVEGGVPLADKYLQKPRTYLARGLILNAADGTGIQGSGHATVIVYPSALAEVHFSLRITSAGTRGDYFEWGLNRDLLRDRNSFIPVITPIEGGRIVVYKPDGALDFSASGFGGFAEPKSQYWLPARVLDPSGSVGGWQENQFAYDTFITGTVYGTVNT